MTDPTLHLYASVPNSLMFDHRLASATSDDGAEILMAPGLRDIIAERLAQIERHGFTRDHDAGHLPEHLALAGASYVNTAIDELHGKRCAANEAPDTWPFPDGWHPGDTRANLVKGIAILWAAIDRLDAAPRDAGDA